ncbi:MAG: YfhO family protein [Candidatus Aureabacteria bacterium]|nr:YfhO family protein [Candidatus Auribacterota bacterium]
MNKNLKQIVKKYSGVIEIVAGITAVVVFIHVLRIFLLKGETTLMHDNFYWGYPVFQFFTENILNGHFPLWNPFTHAGEPFYPVLFTARLLDPNILLSIFLGKFFTNDIILLYNWTFFLQNLIMVFGIYLLFRPLARNLFVRLSLIPILLYSSLILVSFRQGLPLRTFIWVPFITYFLLRIIYYKDYRWHNWLFLSGLIGLNWQFYYFSNLWTFLLLFFLGFVFFRRDLLKDLFRSKNVVFKFIAAGVIIFAMMMPNIILMLEKDNYVYPARMIYSGYEEKFPQGGPQQFEGDSLPEVSGIVVPYGLMTYTGSFSTIWNFIQIISPEANKMVTGDENSSWGKPSEAYMYLGLLPWAIALFGMAAGRHGLKRLWLFLLFVLGLLMLGPSGGLHRILYYIFPPLWFNRHTQSFTLFFLLPFLFFYVLGFNRIFSTWDSSLFSSNNKTGPIKHLIHRKSGNSTVSGLIALLLFFCSIVGFVYWMTNLEYPQTNYLFLLIISVFAIGWLLRNDLGEKGIYTALISGSVGLVLILGLEPLGFITKVILFLLFPVILFLFVKTNKRLFKNFPIAAVLLIAFALILIEDLIAHLDLTAYLYRTQRHPKKAFNFETSIRGPVLPRNRKIVPVADYVFGNQFMRYLSLIYHQSYVFSPVMKDPEILFESQKNITFDVFKNHSFEEWIELPEGQLLPEGCIYCQEGIGGFAKRYDLEGGVAKGKYSVFLSPSSKGNSMLRFSLPAVRHGLPAGKYGTGNIEAFRGQFIKVSGLVKSRNESSNCIQLDIQDGVSPVTVSSYSNSGEWERISVIKRIDENAKEILLNFNVFHKATAGALFDEVKIEIGKGIDFPGKFEKALYSKRWSTFLLLKSYFNLINSRIPSPVLEKMFAVEEPVFQFKQGVVETQKGELIPFLEKLDSDEAVQLLEKYVLAEKNSDLSMEHLKISLADYKRSKASSYEYRKSNKFSYSIKKYEYSSFDMEVCSDKAGVLYWPDGYDKRWNAYINGKKVPVYRVNVNFKAIYLPAGTNLVSFVYEHSLFTSALFVFYSFFAVSITAGLAALAYCCFVKRGKKSGSLLTIQL